MEFHKANPSIPVACPLKPKEDNERRREQKGQTQGASDLGQSSCPGARTARPAQVPPGSYTTHLDLELFHSFSSLPFLRNKFKNTQTR